MSSDYSHIPSLFDPDDSDHMSDKNENDESTPNAPIPESAQVFDVEDTVENEFEEFDEDNFDEDFDDDFEEEVVGEYNLEDDEYGAEFNQEFGHLTKKDDDDKKPDKKTG